MLHALESRRATDHRQGVDAFRGGLVPGVTLPTFLGLRADLRSFPLNPLSPRDASNVVAGMAYASRSGVAGLRR
jgi:hypothetical protein